MQNGPSDLLVLSSLSPANSLKHAVAAFKSSDGCLRQNFHVRQARNPINEITRHARRKASAAHEEPHLGNLACEINHGLAGRVASTHQGNLLTGAQLRFKRGGPIVNACSLELLYSGNRQSTVTRAAGNHDGTGKRMLAIRQLQRK